MLLVIRMKSWLSATLLFILLSPGFLLTLPAESKGFFMSRQTSLSSIIVHALIFAVLYQLYLNTCSAWEGFGLSEPDQKICGIHRPCPVGFGCTNGTCIDLRDRVLSDADIDQMQIEQNKIYQAALQNQQQPMQVQQQQMPMQVQQQQQPMQVQEQPMQVQQQQMPMLDSRGPMPPLQQSMPMPEPGGPSPPSMAPAKPNFTGLAPTGQVVSAANAMPAPSLTNFKPAPVTSQKLLPSTGAVPIR